MKLKCIGFVLIFLLSILKGRQINFISYLRDRYDSNLVKCYRRLEDLSKKLVKINLDIDFLKKCKIYNVVPKFLRFKLYKKSLASASFYRAWQIKLLDSELLDKVKQAKDLETTVHRLNNEFCGQLNIPEGVVASSYLERCLSSYRTTALEIHTRKLMKLNVTNNLEPVDPKLVVHNYSSIFIPFKLKTLLAFGLQFKLPHLTMDFHKCFYPIEQLAYRLSKESCVPGKSFKLFREKLQFLSKQYFYEFNPAKIFSPIFSKCDIQQLREFGKRKDLFVSTPDKGNGIVIVDKSSYLQSMYKLVDDVTKFKPISEPIQKFSTQIEDKINRFLLQLKKAGTIADQTYNKLHATGTGPGILYGKPKIHKSDFSSKFQFRPILAAYNQASYKISKYIVPILSNLTSNQYTVLNSAEFVSKIQNINDAGNFYMASFDIDSLFTNIPLRETIDICTAQLFSNCTQVHGFDKTSFTKLLELASLNSFFLFNGKYYRQVEGLGMGIPLGSTFANAFMCHHEVNWMDEFPLSFKPAHYFRYIDDTFLLFRKQSHCSQFFHYLNNKHPNIRFTVEHEQNNTLPFLDVKLERSGQHLLSSVYRKPSFSGLGTSYFSYCCSKFKVNVIQTLLHRAYNICSSNNFFQKEVSFLKQFFSSNGYPSLLFNQQTELFLSKKLDYRQVHSTVEHKPFFYKLQYYGHMTVLLNIQVSRLITEFYSHLKPVGILVNNYSVGSFFKCKDSLPLHMRSCVVYKYSCPQSNCGSEYVGSTLRTLGTRVMEHRGLSTRTEQPLLRPSQSSIRDHCVRCSGDISLNDFVIIKQFSGPLDYELRLAESIHIFRDKPNLNDTNSAFPLQIVR